MKQKLIVLALAALPASAALAEVEIYGEVRGGYEYNKTYAVENATNAKGDLVGRSEINDWTSRLGFRGSEDLGNGLKAIWQLENGFNVDGENEAGSQRDTFLGLSSDWGKFRLGKLSNYANSDMAQVDPGYYSNKSVAGLGYFTRQDGRVNNAVRYDSPTWDGFSFALLYGTDEERVVAANERTNNQTWNLGLAYVNKEYGFFGRYNYQHWNDAKEASSLKDWHRLEAGYDANNIYAVLAYQQIKGYDFGKVWYQGGSTVPTISTGDAYVKSKEAAITLGYRFMDAKLTPYLTFAKGWKLSTNSTFQLDKDFLDALGGYKQYVLGLNYDLSKQTSLYGSFGHVKWDAQAAENERSFGLGMIHRF